MKLAPCFKSVVVAASFAAFTVASSRAATVYSDDFTTNPFTSAWTQTFPVGSYDLLWTGSANPNSWGGIAAGLPTNANSHSVYSFSDGKRTMSTVDTSVPAGVAGWTSMTYSLDFQMGGTGGVDNNEIGVLVNRSGTNGYNAAIYTGGNGNIAFYGDYGVAFTGINAVANTWYRFQTTLTKSGADIFMQSQILSLSNTVLTTSQSLTFLNAVYTDPNGFQISLGNYGGYWNHATQIDNFVVTAADSYWYWAPGAGGGGTGTWSAGGTNWAAGAGIQGSGTQSTNTTLLFGNTAGTVTVSNEVNVAAGMTFSTDGYTVTDSTITLTGANAASNTITTAASVGTTVASQLAGSNGMTKAGTGTLTLTASNTYTGATTVRAGTLVVDGSISSATTVQSGATLGGSGTIGGPTTISGTLAPGNSPGTLTLTNGLTLSGGGNYNWQIFGLTGTAGQTNTWDLIDVTGGTWDISGLSSTNKFNINLWSLGELPDTTGAVAGFDATQTYSWKILASVGLSTKSIFNAAYFNINTSAINGTGGFVGATGLFSLELDGNNDLFLKYSGAAAAVPEPETWAAAARLVAAAGLHRALGRKAAREA